jgi:2-(1,2-epoxy-1,2-dihydrophenyl)acetyl-CoA isomerase
MSYEDFLLEQPAEHVVTVEFCRPEGNYIDATAISRLADIIENLASDPQVRVAVLASQGRHFCAGARLDGASQHPGATDAAGSHIYHHAVRLFAQPIPLVAAVQGGAIGAGLGLALAADLRVATPSTKFAANFTRLGFHHGFGMTVTLPRVVGQQRALELLYTGARITGADAYRIGLCDRLVDPADLRTAAIDLAKEVATSAPLAVAAVRATMRAGLAEAVRNALVHERSEQDRLMATADFAEGVAASTQRRRPDFIGR